MASSFHEPWEVPEMADVAALAENVVYRLPGVADVMVRKMLQVAYADFARLSCCFVSWRDIETEEDEASYPVAAMIPGMTVMSVSEVRLDGRKLVAGRDYRIFAAGVVPVVVLEDHTLTADPRTLSIRAVELPKYNSEKAPRWFIEKYGEAVVAGALVKLYGMGGRRWSDADMARQEMVRYENFCTEARLNSLSADGSQSGSGSVNPIDMSGVL